MELGVLAAARARHAMHFLDLGEHLAAKVHQADGAQALRRLALEADNLRAAFRATRPTDPDRAARIALALDDVIATGGRAGERVATLDAALQNGPAPWLRARLRIARARPRILMGDAAGAVDDGTQALLRLFEEGL